MTPLKDKISTGITKSALTIKGIVKIAFSPRKGAAIKKANRTTPIIILGNGPSLRTTLTDSADAITRCPTMAVNFFANTPEFFTVKPDYYVIADPHFSDMSDPNVRKLIDNLRHTEHRMTLIMPYGMKLSEKLRDSPKLEVVRFHAIGVEGHRGITHAAYRRGLGMPRPRNVMVCAIMCAIWLGYKEIYITGADHTWTQTLSVDENNRVVSIQPHFYTDSKEEKARVTSVYSNVKLHQILESFSIAFKAYHDIADFATSNGVRIINSTPGSFIDAFERAPLP